MTIDEEIRAIMHRTVKEIQAEMDAAGVNASRRTRNSLQVRRLGDGEYQIIQYGNNVAPFETIERGRPAGKVPYRFSDILYQWSIDKGIQFDTDRERRTFAYFLSKKIATEGTPRSGSKNPRPLNILDPIIARSNRDIQIAANKTISGYVRANIRYAMDSVKRGAKLARQKVSDIFKWNK